MSLLAKMGDWQVWGFAGPGEGAGVDAGGGREGEAGGRAVAQGPEP